MLDFIYLMVDSVYPSDSLSAGSSVHRFDIQDKHKRSYEGSDEDNAEQSQKKQKGSVREEEPKKISFGLSKKPTTTTNKISFGSFKMGLQKPAQSTNAPTVKPLTKVTIQSPYSSVSHFKQRYDLVYLQY